jgi:hypothetical protein
MAVLLLALMGFLVWGRADTTEQTYCQCYETLANQVNNQQTDSLKVRVYDSGVTECEKIEKKYQKCTKKADLEKTIAAVKEAESKRLKASDNDNYKENMSKSRIEKKDAKNRNDRESDNKSNEEVKTTPKINSNEKTEPSLDFNNFKGGNKSRGNVGIVSEGRGDVNDYGDGSEEGLCVKNCECPNNKWDIDVVSVTAWVTVEINENGTVNSARFAQYGDVKNGRDYTSLNRDINAQKSATKNIILDCFKRRVYKSIEKKYRVTQKIVLRKT